MGCTLFLNALRILTKTIMVEAVSLYIYIYIYMYVIYLERSLLHCSLGPGAARNWKQTDAGPFGVTELVWDPLRLAFGASIVGLSLDPDGLVWTRMSLYIDSI